MVPVQGSALLLVLLQLTAHVSSADPGPREVVTFDFAWRFENSDVDPTQYPSCDSAFEPTEVYCGGRETGAKTAEECQAQCCLTPMCRSWLFHDGGGCELDRQVTTHCSNKTSPSQKFTGRKRTVPAELPPLSAMDKAKASREYDDSSWTAVDAPHDALIGVNYSQNFSDPGHAYIPFKVKEIQMLGVD